MPKKRRPLSRSENMSRIRGLNTRPELALRKRLWAGGVRYRKHRPVHGTRPDLVMAGKRLAVFVDGCFWHGCPDHFVAPRTRSGFWLGKIRGNVLRDRQQTLALEAQGWTVLRLWEHEIESDLEGAVARVEAAIRGRRQQRRKEWRVVKVEVTSEEPRVELWRLEPLRDPEHHREVERRR